MVHSLLCCTLQVDAMYLPAADMGEYSDWNAGPAGRRRPPRRLPSGYFILEEDEEEQEVSHKKL